MTTGLVSELVYTMDASQTERIARTTELQTDDLFDFLYLIDESIGTVITSKVGSYT